MIGHQLGEQLRFQVAHLLISFCYFFVFKRRLKFLTSLKLQFLKLLFVNSLKSICVVESCSLDLLVSDLQYLVLSLHFCKSKVFYLRQLVLEKLLLSLRIDDESHVSKLLSFFFIGFSVRGIATQVEIVLTDSPKLFLLSFKVFGHASHCSCVVGELIWLLCSTDCVLSNLEICVSFRLRKTALLCP